MFNVHESAKEIQEDNVRKAKLNCTATFGEGVLNGTAESASSQNCPAYFDGIMCWPPTPAGSTNIQNCAAYYGFNDSLQATRTCLSDGKWFVKDNATWTNYSNCLQTSNTVTIYLDFNQTNIQMTETGELLKAVKIICQTGYGISFISLIIAFTIMFSIKKLHCSRNILHMNLFASFILRAFIIILKDIIFQDGLGTKWDIIVNEGNTYFKTDTENNFECKLITSLVHYFATANYSWILMEAIYLNNLIFKALFVASSKNLIRYIVMGWGLPLLVITPWIVARILVEDTLCWTMSQVFWVSMILWVPIFISVLIDFVLFIVISVVLYRKLRSPVNDDSRLYLKWAKSTLVLAPLFGVHYSLLTIFLFAGETHVWLACDSFFGSFQGFFVAILYCFMNGEVKSELKPYWNNFLTYLATHSPLKFCFPCRDKYLKSTDARQSVCTTMSGSSFYNNGMLSRHHRSKWDIFCKRNSNQSANKLTCCNGSQGKIGPRTSSHRCSGNDFALTHIQSETAFNNAHNQHEFTIEEEISMLKQ